MKRKITALLLACCMLAALAACTQRQEADSPSPAVGANSAEKGDKDIHDALKKPVKDPDETAGPSGDGRGQNDKESNEQESEDNSNAGEDASGPDLAAFAQQIQDGYEISGFLQRQDPDDEAGAAMLDNYFPGIRELDLVQMEVYLCMISANSGEFSIVEAKDESGAKAATAIFQARIDAMREEGQSYPATVELWQSNARVVSNGNFVLLVCAEDADAIAEEFNGLF